MAGNDFIWRFTPSRTEPRVLEEIFVQRESLLADILERISESVLTDNKHQILLIGPRGIGKTHLIALMHHRVTQDPALSDKVRIAWLLEDETITSFVQLMKRFYELLAEEYPAEFPLNWLEDLLDLPPVRILNALETTLVDKFRDKVLLLFVENLDLIFEGLGDEGQKKWRAFLQTHPFMSVVATSQRIFKSVQSREQPFFGFFTTTHLQPLHTSDAVELLRRIGRHREQIDLVDFLATPEGRSRVRALHHIAGGNHRIYIVLSGFITRESLDDLVEPFEKMADEMTPYYQERMRWLSAQQRQIVEYLCSREDTCTPKEIARHLLATENTVSSQLKKLLDFGYVLRSPRGRESLYELAEPLMRLASEVKEKRRKPLRLLVNFLRIWYRPDVFPQLLVKAGTFDLTCQYEGFQNPEAALACYDKFLETDPQNETALTLKGNLLSRLGRHEAAFHCYEQGLELDSAEQGHGFSRCEPMFALRRWERGFEALAEAFDRVPNDRNHDVEMIIDLIMRLSEGDEELQQHVSRLIAIYCEADALDFLGSGLLRSLRRIDVGRIGLETLKNWREAWLKWGGGYPELEIPLRIFRVGIEYFLQGDEKVLLDLVALERTILRPLLLLSRGNLAGE